MYRCTHVDNLCGTKKYYCIDQNNNAIVVNRQDMLRLIQDRQVSNASAFIRKGTVCIRVDGAVKEKAKSYARANTGGVKDKVISQTITAMRNGLVNVNLSMAEYLQQISLAEFKGSTELSGVTPVELVKLAGEQYAKTGKQLYIMAIKSEDMHNNEMLIATTNKMRGESAIQQYIMNRTLAVLNSRGCSAIDAANLADELRKRVVIKVVK